MQLDSTKFCNGCQKLLSVASFNKRNDRANGFQPKCRECQRVQHAAWRLTHQERRRSKYREFRYGITQADYDNLFESQKGLCAICSESLKRTCVDHSHKTGKVRGLLCQNCNAGIGMLRECPALFNSAILYLERAG